jgi:hypothetical protein
MVDLSCFGPYAIHPKTPVILQKMKPGIDSISSPRRKKDILELKNEIGPKYVIFMVGLPARGKSYICKKLSRYLSWCGFKTKVFNVGNKRRKDASSKSTTASNTHDASFFDHGNLEANKQRDQLAMDSLEEILCWLENGGKIGIHDALVIYLMVGPIPLETVGENFENG